MHISTGPDNKAIADIRDSSLRLEELLKRLESSIEKLNEISTIQLRSIEKLNEISGKQLEIEGQLYNSSNELEKLTRWLIFLTIILMILTIVLAKQDIIDTYHYLVMNLN